MKHLTGERSIVACAWMALACCCGCATGPFPQLAHLNPMLQQEWKIDKQFGPTLRDQLAELETVQKSADRMAADEQERWAQQLSQLMSEDSNLVLKAAIVRTLGKLETPTAASALRLAVSDPEPDVRIAACEAWRDQGTTESVEMLGRLLGSDTDFDVRLAATRCLGRFRDPAAVQALAIAIDDSDPAMQYRAIQSLKSASGRNYGNNVPAWREFVHGGNPAEEPAGGIAFKFGEWF